MLQSIRDRATGFFAWIIVILLIIPFALWGINEYFGGSSAIDIAKVNDVKITRNQFNRQLEMELRNLKKRPEGAAEIRFKKEVLNRMIREELLIQAATERGFRIHEGVLAARIQSNPVFFTNGHFDQKKYEFLLRQNGLTQKGYEHEVAKEMLIQQYLGAVMNSSFVTPDEVNNMLRLQNRKIDLSYVVIPRSEVSKGVKITEDQIKKYYEANRDSFKTREKVKLAYLVLDVRSIEKTIPVNEKILKAYYEEQKPNYRLAEQRKVAHIFVELNKNADAKAIKAASDKANKIYAELQKGGDFAALAKKYSDDAGSASLGGDLGVVEKGIFGPAFDNVVASLKKGEISKPVKTSGGFEIIKLENILPGKQKTYEQVKTELEARYRREKAEKLFYDKSEKLYDLTYENPETLEIASKALGLPIQKSGWITRSGGGTGVLADPGVIQTAFSSDVLAGGDLKRVVNSKPIEIHAQGESRINPVVVVRVTAYEPVRNKTLAEVHDDIRDQLTREQVNKLLQQQADEILAAIRKGENLDKIAKAKGMDVHNTGVITRGDRKHDAKLIQDAFSQPRYKDKQKVSSSVLTSKQEMAVYTVNRFIEGQASDKDPARKFIAQIMQNMEGNAEVEALIASLMKQAEIKIYEDKISPANET